MDDDPSASRSESPGSASLSGERLSRDHQLWVELFVVFNFAGLVGDIFLAHSQNRFHNASEYIPLYFSIVAALALGVLVLIRARVPAVWRDVGHLVGWASVAIGLVGVILHLDSRFFYERTIRSLTYAAPFAAPLAYTGLGLLLIANRMVDARSREWPMWMLLLALGVLCRQLRFQPHRPRAERVFQPDRVAAGRDQRVRNRVPRGAVLS